MGYRSLKRVLGETSLERKCRLLFGTCLFLLISGAFIWVDKIAEEQVSKTDRQKRDTARQTARSFADTGLVKLHFIELDNIENHDDSNTPLVVQQDSLIASMIEDLESHDYRHGVLASADEVRRSPFKHLLTPITPEEQPRIDQLLELKHQRDVELARSQPNEPDTPTQMPIEAPRDDEGTPAPSLSTSEDHPPSTGGFLSALMNSNEDVKENANDPIAIDAIMANENGDQYYAYYQLVEWKRSCIHCHSNHASGALSAAVSGVINKEPVRVVRVIFPHQWTDQKGVHRIRAILTSASILTFFVAMIALYVIVRYVIVKPLQHLRNVSDEISRGATDLRAEIHTNDEFEDLADSFNRMLRHLTDTQQNLRGVNQDLDAKVDELAQLNMQLHEMNRLKSDFLANMSHELRTPLNSIIGFSEVLSGIDSLTDKQKRYANNIQKSGRVLLEMINDILDLAKVESGKMELKPGEFRIASIIGAQCDIVRALSEEKNIDLIVDVADGLPLMHQDQGKIQQILTNLLSNAIKFTPEGGRIDVQVGLDGDGRLLLTVEDTGVGIPEEDREIIFEKFRQSNTVLGDNGLTREYSGTGLGLSIVKELCKLLKGELDFESEVGKGSRFLVWLPIDIHAELGLDEEQEADVETSPPPSPPSSPTNVSAGTSRW